MTQTEILEELKKLTTTERLSIIEAALHSIREDVQRSEEHPTRPERKRQLASAAKSLLPDYSGDGELTIFTTLDSENFYA
jgi:hypothetical protein